MEANDFVRKSSLLRDIEATRAIMNTSGPRRMNLTARDVVECIKDAQTEDVVSLGDAVDEGYLQDWYISSVMDDPPIWTEEHIEELAKDFYLIPKTDDKLHRSELLFTDRRKLANSFILWACSNCVDTTPECVIAYLCSLGLLDEAKARLLIERREAGVPV